MTIAILQIVLLIVDKKKLKFPRSNGCKGFFLGCFCFGLSGFLLQVTVGELVEDIILWVKNEVKVLNMRIGRFWLEGE